MAEQPIGACVVILDEAQTKVLLGCRKNSYKAGWWGLPGGRIDVGEKAALAAQREVLEETNLSVSDLQYLGVIKELQDGYDFIHFAFLASSFSGTVKTMEPDKCEGWEWVSLSDLPEQLLPGHRAALQLYRQSSKINLLEL